MGLRTFRFRSHAVTRLTPSRSVGDGQVSDDGVPPEALHFDVSPVKMVM
ncbi:hypothetical protein ACH3Y9_08310 [Streptomyces sp. WSLK1-5]